MRKRLVIGSGWKMTKTTGEARDFVERFRGELGDFDPGLLQVYVLPAFTALEATRRALAGYPVDLGAQDVFWEDEGPFTGEVSPPMLVDAGCRIVMLGHSERRELFGETDAMIHKKMVAACRHGLVPLLCVGETLAERRAGASVAVLERQLSTAFEGVPAAAAAGAIVLYEPVWAIGKSEPAPAHHIQEMHEAARAALAGMYDRRLAHRMRVIYGGSVSLQTLPGLLALPDVDGCGISRAAWDPIAFAEMVRLAEDIARTRADLDLPG